MVDSWTPDDRRRHPRSKGREDTPQHHQPAQRASAGFEPAHRPHTGDLPNLKQGDAHPTTTQPKEYSMTNSPGPFETSGPSGPAVVERPRRPINMVAGTIGHFVEWYDWYIYGLLAAVFSSQIFPSHSAFASLIAALLTYAIGFVVRPLSGIIISPLADRFGRRTVLTLSVSGMALGSLIIALTPSFATISYAAPVLFVVARIIQGISAGSEGQSAIAFMVEHAPPNKRGL